MASIRLNKKISLVPLSLTFVDKYLPKANPAYVKIYIYALRFSLVPASDFSVEKAAKDLGILESDVINAFEYWKEQNVIKFEMQNGEYYIEFLDLDKSGKTSPSASSEGEKDKKRPRYSTKEINLYMEKDKSVKEMYLLAEKILARPLSTTEITTIFSFYDWLGLPKDVVLMLLEHCASLEKTNIRYVEKVALGWAQNGINTVTKAKKYLDKFAQSKAMETKIKKILQIGDRKFTDTELKYVNSWINELKATEETIKKAYEITIMNTSKLSYPYLNSVLKSWAENGGEFKPKSAPQSAAPKKKGFNNYSEDRDLSDFEKQMLEKRLGNKAGTK